MRHQTTNPEPQPGTQSCAQAIGLLFPHFICRARRAQATCYRALSSTFAPITRSFRELFLSGTISNPKPQDPMSPKLYQSDKGFIVWQHNMAELFDRDQREEAEKLFQRLRAQ